MRDLTFTVYKGARSTAGDPHTRPWVDWVKAFSKRESREAKDGLAIIFGEIAKGKRRSAANVRAAHAIGIDIDKDPATKKPWPDAKVEAAFQALNEYQYFVWTTHSHTPSKPRLRVVLPFADPIQPSDYASAWSGLNQLIGNINDPQTKDISRLHFMPSCPPGAEQHATHWEHPGNRRIELIELPDTTPSASLGATPVPTDDPMLVRRLVNKLRSKMKVVHGGDPIKPIIHALYAGDPLADSGGRHKAIVEATWWLAEKTHDLTGVGLSEIFGGSLAAMRQVSPGDAPTLEEVLDAYGGAVRKLEDSEATAADRREEERKKKAREHQLNAAGAQGYYTEEDLDRIAHPHNWELQELRDKWIIQREGMHWMLDSQGIYRGPYNKEDALVVASKLLARAPVRLMETTRNGVNYRPLPDIVRESGQVAEAVMSDMIEQSTRFDPDTLILHEAVRPLRPLEPTFDDGIDQWLKLMAGPQYPRLMDWLACVSDLSKLLCAIYFDGVPSSGKTLLPTGLARLWTEGPPGDIELVLSDFNDEISRCPLILADEEIPKTYKTATVTAKLRSIISITQRTLKRKFKAPTELRGAIRLVLAANNEFLLDSKDVSSAQDLDAIAQRFLYINVPQEAADFLNETPRKTREAWSTYKIAQHTLWLRQNHEVKQPGKRFWVEGDISQMHRLLMTGSRWNGLVCDWLVRYCMEPNLFDAKATGLIRRGEGELLVNDQAIIDGWELYHKNTKVEPETAKVGAALRAISKTQRRQQLRHGGQRIRYRTIDVDHLLAWSDRFIIGDPNIVLAAVNGTDPPPIEDDDDGSIEDFGSMLTTNTEGTPF